MPSKVKNKLAYLVLAERHIAKFQKLSKINERTLAEQNDRLDFAWKNGYETGVHDANMTHKANEEANLQIKKNLQSKVVHLQNKNDDFVHQVNNLKDQLTNQPEPIMAELGFTTSTGHIVENWRNSWKWISNWCFGLIAFFAVTPIPPELLAVLPEDVRYYLIAFTALCGFVSRYINQSKPKKLPLFTEDNHV